MNPHTRHPNPRRGVARRHGGGRRLADHPAGAPGPVDDRLPAYIRAALTQVQLSVPVVDGALALGRSQGVYLFEHRTDPQRRQALLHLIW